MENDATPSIMLYFLPMQSTIPIMKMLLLDLPIAIKNLQALIKEPAIEPIAAIAIIKPLKENKVKICFVA